MKTRIAAAALCIAAAFGCGIGAAQAAAAPTGSMPTQTPDLTLTIPAIHVNVPEAPELPLVPSPQEVLSFLSDSVLLAGRDILHAKSGDTQALPSVTDTLADKNAKETDRERLNKVGDDFDGFWKEIQDTLAKVPLVGKYLLKPVAGLRASQAWKNDYFRIFFTIGLFLVPGSPVAGLALAIASSIVAGVVSAAVAAVVAFVVVAGPVLALGLFGGLVAGFFALGAGVLAGGAQAFFAGLFFLLFLGGGIALIVFGAMMAFPSAGLRLSIGMIILGIGLVLITPLLLIGVAAGLGVIIGAAAGAILLLVFSIATPFWLVGGIVMLVLSAVILSPATLIPPLAALASGLAIGLIVAGLVTIFFGLLPIVPILIALGVIGTGVIIFLIPVLIGMDEPKEPTYVDTPDDPWTTARVMDNVAPKNPLNVVGDFMDWFWDDMQWTLGLIPFIGPSLRRSINAMRASDMWKSDPFRIAITAALFAIVVIPAIAVVASLALSAISGIVTAIIVDLALASPLMALGLLLAGVLIVLGLIIVPVLFLASLVAIIMGIIFIVDGAGIIATGIVGGILIPLLGLPAGVTAAVAGGIAIAMGVILLLVGILVLLISIIPFIWIPLFVIFLVLGVLIFGLLAVIGMILAAPVAIAAGLAVFALLAIILTPIVPVISIPLGLVILGVGLILGLVLPTRPKGEPAPKVTQEDDPDYIDRDKKLKEKNNKPTNTTPTKDADNGGTTIPGVDLFDPNNPTGRTQADYALAG